MLEEATVTRTSADTPADAISRRALLTASAGLVGAAAMASGSALAQTPATPPTMPASQAPVRNDWLARHTEDILDPGLPIIDPHHHLYDRPRYTYLFPDLLADVGSGHNIRATLYEQAGSMYRADGPEELKSLGETEFVCGVAAMSASGNYGPTRCIAGVVGYVDLHLGSRAKGVLERHIEIRQLVGIGAMGRVYRAFQKGIDRDVAVKILHRELSANPTLVTRFHREAKVASRLQHPNVVVGPRLHGAVEGARGGIVQRTNEAGRVARGRHLAAALGEGALRLSLEIDDIHVVLCE